MINDFKFKDTYNCDDLLEIVSILRAPGGCPWDAEQTHESIRRDFIEETYEVIEAINKNSTEMLREELGDVLLQVVFHTLIETEKGTFTFNSGEMRGYKTANANGGKQYKFHRKNSL